MISIIQDDEDAGKHRDSLRISDRDRNVFKFLWRFRAGTMRGLHAIFFADTSLIVCQQRLKRLREFGYLSSGFLGNTENRIWRLGERGFYAIRDQIGVGKMGKYRSNDPQIDHVAMSTLLGDWYLKTPGLVRIITNQELCHTPNSEAPKDTQSTTGSLPNGLWRFRIGPIAKVVALRIELEGQDAKRYQEILLNPMGQDHTIWIAPTPIARTIQRTLTTHSDLVLDDHHFLNLQDLHENLWHAKFKNGPLKGITLAKFLNSFLTVKPKPKPPTSCLNSCPTSTLIVSQKNCATHPLLDFRGTYENSNA